MPRFEDILSKKIGDVKEPKAEPVGTYLAAVTTLPEQRTAVTKDGEKEILRFRLKLISPGPDVDQDQLNEVEETNGPFQSWMPLSHDIWVDSPRGENELISFIHDVLGIEKDEGKSIGQVLTETPGKQLTVSVKHTPVTIRGTPRILANIASVAKV